MPDINYSLTARQRLVDLLRSSNMHERIDTADITFHRVDVVSRFDRNSRIVATITVDGVDVDRGAIYNNRLELSQMPGAAPDIDLPDVTGAATTHDLLPYILNIYGIHLATEDIVDEPITGDVVTLRATEQSLGWIGDITVNLDSTMNFIVLRTHDDRLITVNGFYLRIRA